MQQEQALLWSPVGHVDLLFAGLYNASYQCYLSVLLNWHMRSSHNTEIFVSTSEKGLLQPQHEGLRS